MSREKISGFSLIELLVAIAILAILMAIALPSFNSSMARSRLTSHTELMIGALSYARAEAIKLNENVNVSFDDGDGWVVKSAAVVLKKFAPSSKNITVDPSATIIYRSNGFRDFSSSEEKIGFCDENANCRCVIITGGGSVSVTKSAC